MTPEIKTQELWTLRQEQPEVPILDVRDHEAYAAQHITGAINVPIDELEAYLARLDPARPVIVACGKGGGRSSRAADLLIARGFPLARAVAGGTLAWAADGLPTEKE